MWNLSGFRQCWWRLQHHLRRPGAYDLLWLLRPLWGPPVDPLHCLSVKKEHTGDRPYRKAHDLHPHSMAVTTTYPPETFEKWERPCCCPRRKNPEKFCGYTVLCVTRWVHNSLSTCDTPTCIWHQSRSSQNINCPSKCEYLKISWTTQFNISWSHSI